MSFTHFNAFLLLVLEIAICSNDANFWLLLVTSIRYSPGAVLVQSWCSPGTVGFDSAILKWTKSNLQNGL